jgi:hypothetical protein
MADRTIATVVKAPGGGGLAATSAGAEEARRGLRQFSRTPLCAEVHRAMMHELVRCCGSPGKLQRARACDSPVACSTIPCVATYGRQGMLPKHTPMLSPLQPCSALHMP